MRLWHEQLISIFPKSVSWRVNCVSNYSEIPNSSDGRETTDK